MNKEKKILIEDYEYISEKIFKLGNFDNSTILITGATGLLGSLLVKSIVYANEKYNCNITILACVRNEEKAANVFSQYLNNKFLKILRINLFEPITLTLHVDFIIHTASITASKEMVERPIDVLLTSIESTKNILEFARRHPNCKMVYISSMEYYGQVLNKTNEVSENELGYLDLRKVRSCYPESKRVCESLCNAYVHQFGVHVCSARLAQTFGAGVPFSDNRVFAQFAKSALSNKNIVLHTTGKSEGNYCYTADAIYAIFLMLEKGQSGESYNVAHTHSTIFNMAKLVSDKIARGNIDVDITIPNDINNYGYAPTVKLKLNSDKLKRIGWTPSFDLEDMFLRMIQSW